MSGRKGRPEKQPSLVSRALISLEKKMNLFSRFVLVLFAGIALLVALLSHEFGQVLQQEMFEMLELVGRMVAKQVDAIADQEMPSEAAFSAALQDPTFAGFRGLEQKVLRLPDAVRIKVWDRQKRVVYSNDRTLIGKSFPHNQELGSALQGHAEVMIGLSKPERLYEGHGPERRLLEVYVPLRPSPGKPVYGAVEVYIYPPSFFANLERAKRNLRLISLSGGVGVFLALGWMFWMAWRKERHLSDQLAKAHRFNENIIEHVGTGILVLDREFTILGWNKSMERICGPGIRREKALGRPFFDVVPCACKDLLRGRVEEVFRSGASYTLYAQQCPVPEGWQEQCVNIGLVPIEDDKGRPSQVLVTIEDVSEVRRLEAQLLRSERLGMIGEIYAGLTHEINNPLGVMVTRIKMLLADGRQEGYPPELMNNLEVIEAHSGRIAEIVRNLLGFARTAAPRTQRIDVNTLITEALAMVEIPFAKSQITTHPVLQSDLPAIQGDPNLLNQVLVNLLTNARDAMPRGGRVWLRTRRAPDQNGAVVIEVEDEGGGVAPEIIDKIFRPFFTTKEVGRGTGLGLSVSYGIIRSHGGDLQVKNRDGAGAVFSIVLPVEDRTP